MCGNHGYKWLGYAELEWESAKLSCNPFESCCRAVLLCSTVALSKELGEGPLAGLEQVQHLVQPHQAASRGVLLREAPTAAAAALRRGQQRMDEVVAVMQRIKQLQALAVGPLAAVASEGGAPLAAYVPPLFGASQVTGRPHVAAYCTAASVLGSLKRRRRHCYAAPAGLGAATAIQN